MPIFLVRYNKLGYFIFLKGEIGPPLTEYEAQIIVSWLNNTQLKVSSFSLFSFEIEIDDKDEEYYRVHDQGKKIGEPISTKRDVVAIISWLNSSVAELKERLANCVYEPIIGEDPTKEEIKYYMETKKVGYYDAIEQLRKKKYKKL